MHLENGFPPQIFYTFVYEFNHKECLGWVVTCVCSIVVVKKYAGKNKRKREKKTEKIYKIIVQKKRKKKRKWQRRKITSFFYKKCGDFCRNELTAENTQ